MPSRDSIYQKKLDEALDRRGVRIENSNPWFPQVSNPRSLFEQSADAQRDDARRDGAGLPNNNETLGYDPRGGNVDTPATNPKGWTHVDTFHKGDE
jgi:hypothetical protein